MLKGLAHAKIIKKSLLINAIYEYWFKIKDTFYF